MIYKKLQKIAPHQPQIYARVDDDGLVRVTCNATNQEYLEWLAEGNEPLPADS